MARKTRTEYMRAFYANEPPEKKATRLVRQRMRRFGLTEAEFEAMWSAQGGCCAACREPMERSGRGADASAIDHDHKTGKVRALLHNGCNKAVGHVQEQPGRAEGVARYVRDLYGSRC